jgi:very-short-patch-repair endonuclease
MSSPAQRERKGPRHAQHVGGGEGDHTMRDQAKLKIARQVRQDETLPEKKLWEALRNRNCGGFKFVRQAPIGPYIADFACRDQKLIVELDGWTHSAPEERAHDERRTAFLQEQGYRVIRFTNEAAMQGMDGLLTLILDELKK